MSDEERKRNEVMVRVKKGDLGLRNAAEILGISYRQVKRIRKRYRKQGAKGLVHGNVGGNPTGPSRRNSESGRCGWCGRSTPERRGCASGRRWQPNTWPAKTAWR